MNTHKMHFALSIVFVMLIVTVLADCSSWKSVLYHHNYMKGQILVANDKQAYLCIGSDEGARQEGNSLFTGMSGQAIPISRGWDRQRNMKRENLVGLGSLGFTSNIIHMWTYRRAPSEEMILPSLSLNSVRKARCYRSLC